MNSYPSWNLHLDNVEDWAYFDNAFTAEECDALIKYGREQQLDDAKINNTKDTVDSIRKSKVAFIPPTEFMAPYYQRVSDIVLSVNEQFFKFDLHGFSEHFQFTEYETPGGKYESHVDRAYRIRVRKLSIVVQLTDPETYTGGDLEWISSIEHPRLLPRTRGTLIAFPSYVVHRVTPVTSGTRNSLVGWVTGKQFR